jgi:hypothetical protein
MIYTEDEELVFSWNIPIGFLLTIRPVPWTLDGTMIINLTSRAIPSTLKLHQIAGRAHSLMNNQ